MTDRPYARVQVRVRRHRAQRELASFDDRLKAAQEAEEPRIPAEWREASVLAATIHPFAGLGHQVSSWVSGELWARDLGMRFAGGALTQNSSNLFSLDRDVNVPRATPKVRLQAVPNELNAHALTVLKSEVDEALARYRRPVQFSLALDQARFDQTPASATIRQAVLGGTQGASIEKWESSVPRVVLHVRRGDVNASTPGSDTVPRYVDLAWHQRVATQLQEHPALRDLPISAVLQDPQPGEVRDALEPLGVEVRAGGERDSDFAWMASARVLVAAPSSFSFFAGMGSRGVVVARHPWWHHVPSEGRWVRADMEGALDTEELTRALE
ncbi:hypothetical protein [Demequina sediminicola]|uniref:hypothetical protein n=1 Tax=Demequina sediminicola TaxID=1095026 RepID=UPI00128B2C15|nr:hypothetical protein [Demequina sediminicola]